MGPRNRRRRGILALAYAGGHLFVLSAFAFAQPLFDLLSRNAEFFAVRGSTRSDIVGFALGVLLVPAAVLLVVEALALLTGVLVWRAVHLLFVAALCALIVLHAIHRQAGDSGILLLVLAGLTGVGAAWCYVRFAPARSFLTVLLPAPFVLAALFLFTSPVSKLLSPEDEPAVADAKVTVRTPVVLVVFDELTTVSLLDAGGRIDAKRYPNFARLAANATFYRDTTTVHGSTEQAVPAILTGRLPKPDALPILADHPQNIFTLLGSGYRIRAHESITHLCPRRLCRRNEAVEEEVSPGAQGSPSGSGNSFASDISILYAHALLPESMAAHLPAIDSSWRDFRGGRQTTPEESPSSGPICVPVCRMVRSLESARAGTLYVYHAPIPHPPWRYLPSGRAYLGDTGAVPGLVQSVWGDDGVLARQAYARYLLQVGAVDRALGLFLDRLRKRRLYDRALVVVTSDHGLSFESGGPRREPTAANLEEIAFVPLFVKLPLQRRGRVRPGLARTIDVLPTIADALDVRLPWPVDGRSLLGGRAPADGTVTVMGSEGRSETAPLSELLRGRAEKLRIQVAVFGSGTWGSMYATGPLAPLVGRALNELGAPTAGGLSLDLDGRALLETVDPSSQLIPAYVTGRISAGAAGWDLAVALNGRVVTTARSYSDQDGQTRFAALAPERALQSGRNEVEVLVSRDGILERIEPSEPSLTLEAGELRRADGSTLPLDMSVEGTVLVKREGGRVDFSGWAADRSARAPADAIAVFLDGRLFYIASGAGIRRNQPAELDGIEGVGFGFALPESSLPEEGSDHVVRVFALTDSRVAELAYPPDYPWDTS